MVTSDYYALFLVAETATQQEIEDRWKVVRRLFHPDAISPEVKALDPKIERAATLYFQSFSEAYDTLSNPPKRTEYDRRLRDALVDPQKLRNAEQGLRDAENESEQQRRRADNFELDLQKKKSLIEQLQLQLSQERAKQQEADAKIARFQKELKKHESQLKGVQRDLDSERNTRELSERRAKSLSDELESNNNKLISADRQLSETKNSQSKWRKTTLGMLMFYIATAVVIYSTLGISSKRAQITQFVTTLIASASFTSPTISNSEGNNAKPTNPTASEGKSKVNEAHQSIIIFDPPITGVVEGQRNDGSIFRIVIDFKITEAIVLTDSISLKIEVRRTLKTDHPWPPDNRKGGYLQDTHGRSI